LLLDTSAVFFRAPCNVGITEIIKLTERSEKHEDLRKIRMRRIYDMFATELRDIGKILLERIVELAGNVYE
jgi:hypothetical protein